MLVRMLWKRKKNLLICFTPTVFHFHFDYVQKKKWKLITFGSSLQWLYSSHIQHFIFCDKKEFIVANHQK